jgi:hypothetical protein
MTGLAGIALLFFLVVLGISFVIEILFLLNLQRTLERVSLTNRAMTPGLVWLQIIPVFGFVWFLYVVVKVRDSLRAEYKTRGWPTDSDFGLNIGIAAGVLQVVSYAATWASDRYEAMQVILIGGALVCWVIYWVRTAGYKKRLGAPGWEPGANYGGAPFPPPYPGGPGPTGTAAPPEAANSLGDAGQGEDDSLDEDVDDPAGDGPGQDSLFCPVCATRVREGDRFCHVCGSQLPWEGEP